MKVAIPVAASNKQYYLNFAYPHYLRDAGLEPFLITPENDPIAVAEFCDGLLLPGGGDIDPVFYGEDNYCSYRAEPDRDDFERSVYHAFLKKEKKVFGICRGFQMIFLEFMRLHPEHASYLDYYQHWSSHSLAEELKTSRYVPTHAVRGKPHDLYGEGGKKIKNIYVNSMHHQVALALPGDKGTTTYTYGPLKVIGHTRHGMESKKKEPGFIIEAIDLKLGGGVRGVQWHPEELHDVALLKHFFLDVEETEGDAEEAAVTGET